MRDEFERIFGATPTGVWSAPGRVNLIGEHTDYNEGFVLPIALPQAVKVAARARDDDRLRLYSVQGDDVVTDLSAAQLVPGAVTSWAAYPASVVWALREAGHRAGGADLYFDSDVPGGAGLSSSAALECAVAIAYRDLYRLDLTSDELALIAQRAENDFAGVPCGVMDQMASASCVAGAALFLDTRPRSVDGGAPVLTHRHVPFRPDEQGLVLLVIDTRVKHDLGDGAYAALRAGCERAAELLGLAALRDLDAARLPAALDRLPAELGPMVRHVVSENERVERAVALLDKGDFAALGPILTAGHASLRDDFRVSCAETDLAVDAAVAAGALGARMTGGGFGGSVIALVPRESEAAVEAAVEAAFLAAGHLAPRVFAATAAAGAHRES
ncbi:galactokinase [Kitasatospora sp. NBC_01287]|uniref:galactokinase n=1 Tax=Kitasatospora sp. NBC_01287 TaxID=2903573 RepID=UPI00225AE151|nr:galactokinase [Kitasatospora sp. NBC_01287]MCX4747121.1 galactokinase [Kitasatospora sp. NBC_01287]